MMQFMQNMDRKLAQNTIYTPHTYI